MDLEVTGYEENIKKLEKTMMDIEPEGFAEWVNKIEKTAKEICKDPDCKRITFKPIEGKIEISMNVTDKEALDCLRKAIEQHKESMSDLLKDWYIRMIKTSFPILEEQLKKKTNQ